MNDVSRDSSAPPVSADAETAHQPDREITWDAALQSLQDDMAWVGRLRGEFAVLQRMVESISKASDGGRGGQAGAARSLSAVATEIVNGLAGQLETLVERRRVSEALMTGLRERHESLLAERHSQAQRLKYVSNKRSELNRDNEARRNEVRAVKQQMSELQTANRRLRLALQRLHRRRRIFESRLLPKPVESSPSLETPKEPQGRLQAAWSSALAKLGERGGDPVAATHPPMLIRGAFSPAQVPAGASTDRGGEIELRRTHRIPLPVRPGLWTIASEGKRAVVAVLIFGLPPDVVSDIVDRAGEEMARRADFAPLFITDCKDMSIFRREQYTFEYFPPARERQALAPDLDWATYFSRRAEALRRKWRPAAAVCFGSEPPIRIEILRDSPGSG